MGPDGVLVRFSARSEVKCHCKPFVKGDCLPVTLENWIVQSATKRFEVRLTGAEPTCVKRVDRFSEACEMSLIGKSNTFASRSLPSAKFVVKSVGTGNARRGRGLVL